MSISPLSNLANNFFSSIVGNAQNSSPAGGANQSTNSTSISAASGNAGLGTDQNELSPLAQLLSTLQQLQVTNPTEYAQLTGQIATNLQAAAATAQSGGNTTQANQLNQLASDFSSASKNGQLPNIEDLAQAIGGHHHHHHHHGNSSSDSDSSSDSSDSSNTNPLTIILNTLASNGISLGGGSSTGSSVS